MHTTTPFDLAIDVAASAALCNELPVSCVCYINDQLYHSVHNMTNIKRDPLAHCEKIVVEKIIHERINKGVLDNSTDYNKRDNSTDNSTYKSDYNKRDTVHFWITLEPCAMCFRILHSLSEFYDVTVSFGVHNEIFGMTKIFPEILHDITERAHNSTNSTNSTSVFTYECLNDSRAIEVVKEFYTSNRNNRV